MKTKVDKVYERLIVTPYKSDGYDSLIEAIDKIKEDVQELRDDNGSLLPRYNDQYVVRVTIEKLED